MILALDCALYGEADCPEDPLYDGTPLETISTWIVARLVAKENEFQAAWIFDVTVAIPVLVALSTALDHEDP